MSTVLDYDAVLKSHSANSWAHAGKSAGAKGSGRVRYRMVVRVSLPDDPSYSTCETMEIGAGGALVLIPRRVEGIATLLLINPKSSRQAACRVVDARPQTNGRTCVEVEFLADSPSFWGVSLNSLSAEASGEGRGSDVRKGAAKSFWRGTLLPALAVGVMLCFALFLMAETFEYGRPPGAVVVRMLRFLAHPGSRGGSSLPKDAAQ